MKYKDESIPKRINLRWRNDGEDLDYIIYQHPVTGIIDMLNPVAASIFRLCDGDNSIETILDNLEKEYYGVDRKTLESDVNDFLNHMVNENIMIIVGDEV